MRLLASELENLRTEEERGRARTRLLNTRIQPQYPRRRPHILTCLIPLSFRSIPCSRICPVSMQADVHTLVHSAGSSNHFHIGIQITYAKKHENSRKSFMERSDNWRMILLCNNIKFKFLWIVKGLPNNNNRQYLLGSGMALMGYADIERRHTTMMVILVVCGGGLLA